MWGSDDWMCADGHIYGAVHCVDLILILNIPVGMQI
jgi:hypothetical protein